MSRYYERRTGDWEQCYLLNPADHEYFFRIRSQWNAWISNPKHPDLDRIYRILHQSGFGGFEILFWICSKERKIHFWIWIWILSKGTHPHLKV